MSNTVSGFAIPHGPGSRSDHPVGSPANRGSFSGRAAALVEGDSSLLRSMDEEMTFSASAHVESKSIERRNLRQRSRPSENGAAQRIDAMVNQIPQKEQGLRNLLQRLRQSGAADPRAVLGELRRSYEQPAHRFAALEALRTGLVAGPLAPPLDAAVEEAYLVLTREEGPAAREALDLDRRLDRHLRREEMRPAEGAVDLTPLQGRSSLPELHDALKRQFGKAGFVDAAALTIAALGDALHGLAGAGGEEGVSSVVNDLFAMEVLVTLHERCGRTVGRLRRDFGLGSRGTAAALMDKILPVTRESYFREGRFDRIAAEMEMQRLDGTVCLLHELRESVRLLPMKVFASPEDRQKVLTAAQGDLDRAISRESEEGFEDFDEAPAEEPGRVSGPGGRDGERRR